MARKKETTTLNQIEQAHQEWINALDAIEYPIFLHDKEFRILRCNKAYSDYASLPYSDIIGYPYYTIFPKHDGPMPHCAHALENNASNKGIEDEILVDGKLFQSRGYISRDSNGEYLYSLHILEDITEQRRVEEALRDSEEKFHNITASAQDAIIIMNENEHIIYWNYAAEMMFGYSEKEVLNSHLHQLLTPSYYHNAYSKGFEHFKQTSESPVVGKTIELSALRKNGEEFPIELSLSISKIKNGWIAIGIVRDITERKHSEMSLNRANRALKTLSAGNMALVKAKSENELLQNTTNIIVQQAGYDLAAVIYAENNPQQSIKIMAGSGLKREEYQWASNLSWADTSQGQLPVSIAIRTGQTQVCRNIACNIGYELWKKAAILQGYISNIALPLINNEKTFGAICIYSKEETAFDNEEIKLLEELANDLAYGIMNLRTRFEHEQQSLLLRASLEQSIQTIASTIEARDPYTAGHQRRVAELAVAIAHKMNLDENQIQGIQLAATIHDLGKIHIPAEILAKPGRLNDIEFMLIRTHPQEGYNILKDVKFPWPIAEIILQHHERIDGSGYPQGLKGEKILLEAKIMCVADVVEAMSSHRPYRPSLGVNPALDEIRRGCKTWYDESVVGACLALFEEDGFKFSTIAM